MILSTNEATGFTCEQLPAERYHAHEAIGASMLEDFRKSRRLFEARYVTKAIAAKEPTPAMELGTLIHLRILEPQRYERDLAPPAPDVAPDGKKWLRRKGSDHERWWEEYEESVAGKIIADNETRAMVEAIAKSVYAKPWAERLLRGDGKAEFSIFWTDAETGLPLKCRVDWFAAISVDLKSTNNPAPAAYARSLVGLGYARKLAHYRAGISAFTGKDAEFLHIAIGTEVPFPCGCYEIDDRDYYDSRTPRLGEQQWRRTLKELAECVETGDFSDPFERQILELKLPNYAFTEDQWR